MTIFSEIEAIIEPAWVALLLGDLAVVDTMASIGVELGDADRVDPVALSSVHICISSGEGDSQVINIPVADRRTVVEYVAAFQLLIDDLVRVPIALACEA